MNAALWISKTGLAAQDAEMSAIANNIANVNTTGFTRDRAIMGQGFLQVQKANGDTAYTRDGNLQVNADGVLTTAQGLPIQPEIDIPAGATGVSFGEDGTVTATLPGDAEPTELGQLSLVYFVNPAGLNAEGDNLYAETAASGQPTEGVPGEDGLGTIQAGALEGSNVDIVNEMVAMITVQRAYEMNAKMVSAADSMLQFLDQTL